MIETVAVLAGSQAEYLAWLDGHLHYNRDGRGAAFVFVTSEAVARGYYFTKIETVGSWSDRDGANALLAFCETRLRS